MKNESGIWPVEYKCLVQMMPRTDKTEGGIYIPKSSQEKEQVNMDVGIFVFAGGCAFQDPDWPKHNIPKPGQKVLFDRYAGSIQKGMDGMDYRLLNDKEIGALLEEDYECESR